MFPVFTAWAARDEYKDMIVSLRPGMVKERTRFCGELINIQYDRNDMDLSCCCFRVRGDCVGDLSLPRRRLSDPWNF